MRVARIADTIQRYVSEVAGGVWLALRQLTRPASHSRRAEARRRLARRWLAICLGAAIVIVLLMLVVDVAAIRAMPTRGTASLWPVRIVTEFGKAAYVLWTLFAVLVAMTLLLPCLRGTSRLALAGLGVRIQYVFLAVLLPILICEVLKVVVGRGRPFVGGEANAFNFSPFSAVPAFASFPSSHAVTACALAFAISSVWRQTRAVMWTYATIILLSRVVLLAHHPSDLVGGALIGVLSAMFVRYWFAAHRAGFFIRRDGAIEPLGRSSMERPKRVAREAFAP